MDPENDHIAYARMQAEEARRRLESVTERISEYQEFQRVGAIDERKDEIVFGRDIEEIPEKHRQFVNVGKGQREVANIEGHIQNIIIDCQVSVELSVKSMFKAVDQDFDYSHGINFESDNTRGFNNKVPADFPRGEDLIRAIFLTQLWDRFYQLAKYGAPVLNVGPSVIFDSEDGERAINDATFCVNLAEEFIDYIEQEDIQ